MSFGIVASVGGALVGSVISGNAQKKAGQAAADGQIQAAQMDIDQRNKQFEAVQKLLAPYVNAGTGALSAQQNLVGLNGNAAQQQAIKALQNSPAFTSLQQSGQSAILQNASATGGLRGGNVQGALAQFNPALLAQVINDQYGRLGGLTSVGQNAAAGVGNAGMQNAGGIGAALQQQGAARAGAALASGQATAGIGNTIASLGGLFGGLGGGGGASFAAPTASFGSGASYGGLANSLSLGAQF